MLINGVMRVREEERKSEKTNDRQGRKNVERQ